MSFREAVEDLIENEPIENINGIFDEAFPGAMPLSERGALLSAFNSAVVLLTISGNREATEEAIYAA